VGMQSVFTCGTLLIKQRTVLLYIYNYVATFKVLEFKSVSLESLNFQFDVQRTEHRIKY
jgi:hypothetical protein